MSQVKRFFMLPTFLPITNYSVKLEVIFCVQAVISPLMANIYLHVLDRYWTNQFSGLVVLFISIAIL